MHNVAAIIAQDARENRAGVDVISVGPVFAALTPLGLRFNVATILPDRSGQDFVAHDVVLDAAPDEPMLATIYRLALVIALEEFFGRVQIFGTELALAKYCQKKWPSEREKQALAEMVRNRGLN
jgi:hypothetical protein